MALNREIRRIAIVGPGEITVIHRMPRSRARVIAPLRFFTLSLP
jgi:hypothetical protein